MERHGLLGMILAWGFNALAWMLHSFAVAMSQLETLQIISLYLAIFVSALTAVFYISKWEEVRDRFKKMWKNRKQTKKEK